jgi:hypothetical protein
MLKGGAAYDSEFEEVITHNTSHTKSVKLRINKAKEILLS